MEQLATTSHSTAKASLGWGEREGWMGGVATAFAFLLILGWAFTLLSPTSVTWVVPSVLLFTGGTSLVWSRPRSHLPPESNSPWRGFALTYGLVTLAFGFIFLTLIIWGLFFGLTG